MIIVRDVVVIGAGPAGLASSHELARRGIDHVVLERGASVGHSWATLYDSLVLHTGRHLSSLPGLAFPAGTPLFPLRQQFLDYLRRYAARFAVPVTTGTTVTRATRDSAGGDWRIEAGEAVWRARAIVLATGVASNPFSPLIAGRDQFQGRVLHSRDYQRPAGFSGRRVLVVGAGNSAGEIAPELAHGGAAVTIAVRSGAHVVPRDLFGVPIQYLGLATSALPRRVQQALASIIGRWSAGMPVLPVPPARDCGTVPLLGFHLVDAIRAGAVRLAPGLDRFTGEGVRFADGTSAPFDDVILATGYRPAMAMFGGAVSTDACGFARRRDRVVSVDAPTLFVVGHSYDQRGTIFNIGREARRMGRIVARHLHAR